MDCTWELVTIGTVAYSQQRLSNTLICWDRWLIVLHHYAKLPTYNGTFNFTEEKLPTVMWHGTLYQRIEFLVFTIKFSSQRNCLALISIRLTFS